MQSPNAQPQHHARKQHHNGGNRGYNHAGNSNNNSQSPDPHSRLAHTAHQLGIPPPPPQVIAHTQMWAQMLAAQQQQFGYPFGGGGQQQPQQQQQPRTPGSAHHHQQRSSPMQQPPTVIAARDSPSSAHRFQHNTIPKGGLSASSMPYDVAAVDGKENNNNNSSSGSNHHHHHVNNSSSNNKVRSEVELQLLAMPHVSIVDILGELCTIHPDVKGFVEAKIHYFQLASAIPPSASSATKATNDNKHQQHQAPLTPARELKFGDDDEEEVEAAAEMHHQEDEVEQQQLAGTSTPPTAEQQQEQQEQEEEAQQLMEEVVEEPLEVDSMFLYDESGNRFPAEHRPFFSKRKHPCACAFTGCRYGATCMLAQCPGNICLQWLRGHCMNGSDCARVHRIPEDDPMLQALFDASHQQ